MQYFPNIVILLGVLNVTFWFKHKNTVVNYISLATGIQNLGRLENSTQKFCLRVV